MAKKWIEARVIQKIDTLENWNNNPLILYEGEQAFVKTENGISINFKIGDGVRAFKDLPYWIDYGTPSQQVYTSTDWNGKKNGVYIPIESGNYRGVQVDLTKGFTVLIWDGINSLTQVVYPFSVNADGIIEEGNAKPVSGDTVWKALKDFGNIVNDVEEGNFNPVSSNAVYEHSAPLYDAINNGGSLRWIPATYPANTVRMYLGMLWISTRQTSLPPTATSSQWELFNPFGKSYGKIVGKPENVIFNSVNGSVEFKGSKVSQTSVICEMGTVFIKPSTVSNTEDYAVLVVDYVTGVVSEDPHYTYRTSARSVSKVPFAVIINNEDAGKYELYGIEAYTKKDGAITQIYPPNIIGKGEAVTGSQNDIPNVEFMNDAIKEAVESGGVDTSAFVKTKGDNKLDNTFSLSRNGKKINVPFVGEDSTLITTINGEKPTADGNINIAGGEGGGTIDNVSVNGVDAPIVDKRAVLTITKDTVGLGKVNNTSDDEKLPNDLVKAEIAKQIAESGTGGGVELTNEYLPNDQTKATSSTAVKDFDTKTNDFTTNADGGVAGKKYWIKGTPINIGNYYNKQEIDAKLADIEPSITLGFGLTKDSQGKTRLGEEKVVQGVTFNYIATNVAGTDDKGFLIGNLLDSLENSHGFLRYDGFTGMKEVDATLSLMDDTAMVYKDNKGVNIFQNSTFDDGKNRLFANANRIFMTGVDSATLGVVGSNSVIRGIHVSQSGVTCPSLSIQDIETSTSTSIITKEFFYHTFSDVQATVNGIKGVIVYTNDNKVKSVGAMEFAKTHTGVNVLTQQYLLDNYSDVMIVFNKKDIIFNNNGEFVKLVTEEIL